MRRGWIRGVAVLPACLLAAALLSTPARIDGCCMVPRDYPGDVDQSMQEVLILHADGHEELVIRVRPFFRDAEEVEIPLTTGGSIIGKVVDRQREAVVGIRCERPGRQGAQAKGIGMKRKSKRPPKILCPCCLKKTRGLIKALRYEKDAEIRHDAARALGGKVAPARFNQAILTDRPRGVGQIPAQFAVHRRMGQTL